MPFDPVSYIMGEETSWNKHIDPTLSKSGFAADAKETGDMIRDSLDKTPRIKSSTRTWEVWDVSTNSYVDTGVSIDTDIFIDDTLTLSGYAADAKVTGDRLEELKSALSEQVEWATVTQTINETVNGVTIKATSSNTIEIYGTPENARHFCFLNGQDFIRTTSSPFNKTLEAGMYVVEFSASGAKTDITINYTATVFSNDAKIPLSNGQIYFGNDVMIGLWLGLSANFGTEENPTVISFSAKKVVAKDPVARNEIDGLTAYNAIHSPAYQNAFAGFLGTYPTFVFNQDKSITVTIPRYPRAYWNGGYSSSNPADEIRSIVVQPNNCLVYDPAQAVKDYSVMTLENAVSQNVILCFWNTSSGKILGSWLPFLALQEAQQIREEAQQNLDKQLDSVPDYYYANDYLGSKISSIQSIGNTLAAQSARFVFITDYHIGKNSGKSPALAKRIMRETGIKELYFNGDYNDKALTPIAGYKVLCDFLDAVKPLEFGNHIHYTTGNHEYNDPSGSEPELQIDRDPIFQLFNAYDTESVSVNPAATNAYYVDYDNAKIRIYGIDCNYGSIITPETRKYVFDSFLTVPEGYAVLITSHVGKSSASDEDITQRFSWIMQCGAAMNDGESIEFNFGTGSFGKVTYDFTGKARTFIGAITGHTHSDGYVIFDGRFPVIITECDTLDKTRHPEREDGTIIEQAFDVVQVDVSANRIYLTRIGNGSDRVFSFGDNAGPVT